MSFMVHKRVHTGEKHFRCTQCSASFTRLYRLNQHSLEKHDVCVLILKGVFVWDVEDRQYYDFLSACSSNNQSHCHLRIVDAMIDQARTLAITSRAFYSVVLGEYEEYIRKLFGYDRVLPMNSGCEACAAAIKALSLFRIVLAADNFWGRFLAVCSASTEPDCFGGYGLFMPGFDIIPYNDLASLDKALQNTNVAAFMVEPILGEAGVVVPDDDYLRGVREMCARSNVLFIADEETVMAICPSCKVGRLVRDEHCVVCEQCGVVSEAGTFLNDADDVGDTPASPSKQVTYEAYRSHFMSAVLHEKELFATMPRSMRQAGKAASSSTAGADVGRHTLVIRASLLKLKDEYAPRMRMNRSMVSEASELFLDVVRARKAKVFAWPRQLSFERLAAVCAFSTARRAGVPLTIRAGVDAVGGLDESVFGRAVKRVDAYVRSTQAKQQKRDESVMAHAGVGADEHSSANAGSSSTPVSSLAILEACIDESAAKIATIDIGGVPGSSPPSAYMQEKMFSQRQQLTRLAMQLAHFAHTHLAYERHQVVSAQVATVLLYIAWASLASAKDLSLSPKKNKPSTPLEGFGTVRALTQFTRTYSLVENRYNFEKLCELIDELARVRLPWVSDSEGAGTEERRRRVLKYVPDILRYEDNDGGKVQFRQRRRRVRQSGDEQESVQSTGRTGAALDDEELDERDLTEEEERLYLRDVKEAEACVAWKHDFRAEKH